MKGYTIWLSDEEHKRCKVESAEKGISMREYLLGGHLVDVESREVPDVVESVDSVKEVAEDAPGDAVEDKLNASPLARALGDY